MSMEQAKSWEVYLVFICCTNETAGFKKRIQLFEYQHFSYLETYGGESSNIYLNVAHFKNTSVN